jgi:hypothetical protein
MAHPVALPAYDLSIFSANVVIKAPRANHFYAAHHFPDPGKEVTGSTLKIAFLDAPFKIHYQNKVERNVRRAELRMGLLAKDLCDLDIIEKLGYANVGTTGRAVVALRHFHACLLEVQEKRAVKPKRIIAYSFGTAEETGAVPELRALCAEWTIDKYEHEGFEICALEVDAPSLWYKGDEIISLLRDPVDTL